MDPGQSEGLARTVRDAGPSVLARTLRDDELAAQAAWDQSQPPPVDAASLPDVVPPAPPALPADSYGELLVRRGLDPGDEPVGARYQIGDRLGQGSGGTVWSVRDQRLQRLVAVKVLAEGGDRIGFIEEARIAASLQHPNVLPVYDLDLTASGESYFVMKRIEGISLGEALRRRAAGAAPPAIATVNGLVNVVIDVCKALTYAHHRGIIHQDVKPDNILIGDFGEVLLVDWGCAVSGEARGGRLYGTPLYMAPEQARREFADARSDVYCLGASFFDALIGRPPTIPGSDVPAFWARKRRGEIDPPTPAERRDVPRELLAIAGKAMVAAPEGRYAGIDALLADLRAWQAGLAVSAWREPWWQGLRRWHRRHGRALWAWTAAAVLVLSLAGVVWGQRLEQMARWGAPVAALDSAEALGRWLPSGGDFVWRDGRVESTGEGWNRLILPQRISGAVAIEYEALALPDSHPGDLSVFWARDLEWNADHTRIEDLTDSYAVQTGAWDGAYSMIAKVEKGREWTSLAYHDFRPQPGQRHQVRIEVIDTRITLAVDGRQLCEWIAPLPFTGGYMALYAMYPGKTFANVRVYQRDEPRQVPATAIGDAAARAQHYDLAASEYARIADAHPDQPMGREARFKQGLCSWWQGRPEAAQSLWRPLLGSEYDGQIRLHEAEGAFAAGDHERVMTLLDDLCARGDARLRQLAALKWGVWIDGMGRSDPALARRYLDLRARSFPEASSVDQAEARVLLDLRQHEEILRRFPRQRHICCQALMALGRYDVVVRDYPDQRADHMLAAFGGGFFAQLDPVYAAGLRAESMWIAGHPEQVLALPADEPGYRNIRCHALLVSGGHEEILRDYRDQPLQIALALIATGRVGEARAIDDEAARQAVALATGEVAGLLDAPQSKVRLAARSLAMLQAYAAGDSERARALLPATEAWERDWDREGFDQAVFGRLFAPFCESIIQDRPELCEQACAEIVTRWRWTHRQQLWHLAAYITGRIDDQAFLAQPCGLFAPAMLHVARAIRAERRGERDLALAEWRAYLAMPLWLRVESFNAGWTVMAEWRIAALAR